MNLIETNVQEQINHLKNLNFNPTFVSMSVDAYGFYSQAVEEHPTEVLGLKIVVNPYQQAYMVVLSDCVTEFGNRGVWDEI